MRNNKINLLKVRVIVGASILFWIGRIISSTSLYSKQSAPMITENTQDIERADVLDYVKTLNGIISRLENNSFMNKGWLITLLMAMFTGKYFLPNLADAHWLFYAVVVFFWWFDAYYHGLAERFKNLRSNFIEVVVKNNGVFEKRLYKFGKHDKCEQICMALSHLFTIDVIGYYGLMLVFIKVLFYFNL